MEKKFRLIKPADFKKTMDNHISMKTASYSIFIAPNDEGHARYGISTSKKLGKAVIRVKTRRQVRAFISIYNQYHINYDIVIVVRPPFLKRTSLENQVELFNSLDELRKRVGETQGEEIL